MYEWRTLTEVELCAVRVLWRRLGEALGIKYDALTNQGNAGDWADGIEFLEALELWSRAYQAEHMVPAASNHKVARATLGHNMWKLLAVLRPAGEKLAAPIITGGRPSRSRDVSPCSFFLSTSGRHFLDGCSS